MSLLSIVQDASRRLGLEVPTSVIGTLDPQVAQLRGLLEELGTKLALDYNWQALRRSTNWSSVVGEDQGPLAHRTGDGFKGIVRDTFWNFTLRRQIFGPVSDADWQAFKAAQVGGLLYKYRIAGNRVLVYPPLPAGHSVGWVWESNWWVADFDGCPRGTSFTLDTDTSLLPEDMLTVGLQARWNEEKGLPYAELKARFDSMVASYQTKDGTKPTLHLDQPVQHPALWTFGPVGR